jgi:hypothetical protein
MIDLSFACSSLDHSVACQLFLIFRCRLKEIRKITIDFLLNV